MKVYTVVLVFFYNCFRGLAERFIFKRFNKHETIQIVFYLLRLGEVTIHHKLYLSCVMKRGLHLI